MSNVLAIVQARMGSSRLPGKSLADVAGKPMLMRVFEQVQAAKYVDDVVVATSYLKEDEAIAQYCEQNNIKCYRGHSTNVLSRFIGCSNLLPHSTIVRITGDCPLISPDTIDEVLQHFSTSGSDYASNTNPYTRPEGQDVEVFSRDLLLKSQPLATSDIDKEHVTPWMRFADGVKRSVCFHSKYDHSNEHWSVDYQQDLDFVRRVWEYLVTQGKPSFTFDEILHVIGEYRIPMSDTIVNEGYYKSIYDSAANDKSAPLVLEKSNEWLSRSNKVIPGGAQTYSKSWRHHIKGVTPIFLESGEGSWVKDVDGNAYIDFIQGLLPNILGYADRRVSDAVCAQISQGHSFSLPTTLEVQLAEKLTEIIPCAEKVRFGKNGSDATTGAVRVARAYTGRDRVAACGYHGWHDWYIGTTSRNLGVPTATRQLTSVFEYNSIESLEKVLESHDGEYAAVILEPFNFEWPSDGYLKEVKELVHKHGALLIFDEICSGFHFGLGGAQKMFGVTPDLAAFGKAMGNGWPISCIAGKAEIMDVFEDAFFSFTFGGDNASIAAALEVINILENERDYEKMESAGIKIRDGLLVFAQQAGLGNKFILKGHHNWMVFDFLDDTGNSDKILKTLWLQELTRSGLLVLTTLNISSALSDSDVHTALTTFAKAFKYIAQAMKSSSDLTEFIDGEIPTPAFRARN